MDEDFVAIAKMTLTHRLLDRMMVDSTARGREAVAASSEFVRTEAICNAAFSTALAGLLRIEDLPVRDPVVYAEAVKEKLLRPRLEVT